MTNLMRYMRLSQSFSSKKWRSANIIPIVATGVAAASSAAFLSASETDQRSSSKDIPKNLVLLYSFLSIGQGQFAACESTPAVSASTSSQINSSLQQETEAKKFERILAHHCSQIDNYRTNWEYKPPSTSDESDSSASTSFSTFTPSRSWPDDIPSTDELSWLVKDLNYCVRSPNFRSDKDYCHKLGFRVASALLLQFDGESQTKGFEILRNLAEFGYPDAMAFYGMCLNDGRANTDPDSDQAVIWFRRCANMYDHPQAQYELAVALYTGEGVVENEEEAVSWFELAAEQNHPAACYMLGDCLLDGEGVEVDRGAALEWLVRAAELGHRGARSRVMAVLEQKHGEDYGRFTDASRQTLKEHVLHSVDDQGHLVRRKTTLVKEIGGGVRNPTELARRQTIVAASRKDTVVKNDGT